MLSIVSIVKSSSNFPEMILESIRKKAIEKVKHAKNVGDFERLLVVNFCKKHTKPLKKKLL